MHAKAKLYIADNAVFITIYGDSSGFNIPSSQWCRLSTSASWLRHYDMEVCDIILILYCWQTLKLRCYATAALGSVQGYSLNC